MRESEDQLIFDDENLAELGLNLHHQPTFVREEIEPTKMVKRNSTFTKQKFYSQRQESSETHIIDRNQIKTNFEKKKTIKAPATDVIVGSDKLNSDKRLPQNKSKDINDRLDESVISNKTETQYLKKHRDIDLKDHERHKLG